MLIVTSDRFRRPDKPEGGLLSVLKKSIVFVFLVGLVFTSIGIYVTSERVSFMGKCLETNAVVVDNVSVIMNGKSGSSLDYYPVFRFVDSATGENITAQGVNGRGGAPAYPVGRVVEILYNPENPTVGVVENSFWAIWLPSILLLPIGTAVMIGGIYGGLRAKSAPPARYGRALYACKECGVRDDTVQLFIRYGELPRFLCANCRKKQT